MSNYDTEKKIYVIPMPIMKGYQTLICRTERDGIDIVMTYITEKEEIKLEEIKQKNYMLETEKLRLELKQVQNNSPTKAELLGFKQIEPDRE